MMRSLGMIVGCCLLGPVSAGAEEKGVTYVDLQPQANQELTANFGSGREGNNLSELPKGEQTFKGLKFKVEDRFIQLGSELLRDPKPDEVKGIKVGKTFAKLHILHSTLYGNGSELGQEGMPGDPLFVAEGTKIGQYQVHYEDGTSEAVPIVYGQDVRDWWFTGVPKRVTRGKLAWERGTTSWPGASTVGFRSSLVPGRTRTPTKRS
jgi:hypothetical protein